ncbi:methyltransferase domain-containing protein [uncultured Prochlorococcus sp.]|uniref:methyltransferase domain-containing protein n=1 Tax=uncultured Prochlorococcus sp. TaxID=159733 RepID=UPI002590E815|nr:methyltransferase domain-containing protein [uncultured Prochlorococcus sp.]
MVSFANSKKDNISDTLPALEIGCGVTPMKDNYPEIISSDIEETPVVDMVIDAINLPFDDNALKTIYAINCFHHISSKRKFIDESSRVLNEKGKLIMLEPSFSLLSFFLYPFLFRNESYNIFSSIDELDTFDPMKGANQAASYICFKKHPEFFLRNSDLKVSKIFHCKNSFAYILSGGINFPELLPYKYISKIMNMNLIGDLFSLHWIIVLEKRNN